LLDGIHVRCFESSHPLPPCGSPSFAGAAPSTPAPAATASAAGGGGSSRPGSRVMSPQGGSTVAIPVIEPGRDGWRDLHRALSLAEEVRPGCSLHVRTLATHIPKHSPHTHSPHTLHTRTLHTHARNIHPSTHTQIHTSRADVSAFCACGRGTVELR
jgi:hypothetical protein